MPRIIIVCFITLLIFKGEPCWAQGETRHDSVWMRSYRIWSARDESNKQDAIWQAFNAYCREGNDSTLACAYIAEQLQVSEPQNAERALGYCNAAIYFLKQHRYDDARYWWEKYLPWAKETSCADVWMSLCLYDSIAIDAVGAIPDIQACRACLHLNTHTDKSRTEPWVVASSYFLPGMGMVLKGYPAEGVTALLLNGGFAAGVYGLWQHQLYGHVAALSGIFLLKFYTGNIQFTKRLQAKKPLREYNKTAAVCRQRLNEAWQACPARYK